MEISRYDITRTKGNKINKTVPMSKEMSEKVMILCRMMNTDFTKATNDLWISIIMRARECGMIDRPTVIQVVSDKFLETQNPFARDYFKKSLDK